MNTPTPAVGRHGFLGRGVVLGVGAVALMMLTACGSGSSNGGASAGASSGSSSAAPGASQRFPGVTGTIAAVSSGTLQVQNPQSGQTAVTYTASTPVTTTVPATRAALVVGRCATVGGGGGAAGGGGGAAGASASARTVTISTPVNGSCLRTNRAGAGRGLGGGTGTPRPRPSGAAGARGGFGGGFGGGGTITSVTPTSFVLSRPNANGGTTTSTVTTTAATTYSQTTAATDSALKVGQCLTAIGRTGDTGAVAATSLAVRAPGPQGCTTGLRRGTSGGSQ